MTIDTDKIERFLIEIRENVKKLNIIKDYGKVAFTDDFRNYNSSLRLLQVSIESMINIANHIIARRSFRAPKDFSDAFRVLCENGIISQSDLKTYLKMVKFRNRIVHLYWDLDLDFVFNLLENNLFDFINFANKIIDSINKSG